MADRGESELRKWALARPNGDPIAPQDIVALIFAFDDDNSARYKGLEDRLDDFEDKLGKDLTRISTLEKTAAALAEKQLEWELECPAREESQQRKHEALHQEHLRVDHAPRRLDDPPDSEFTESRESAFPELTKQQTSFFQMMAAWSVTKKVLAIVGTLVIIALFGLVTSYIGSLFAADRAEKNGINIEKTALPQPTVTITDMPTP